MTSFWPRSAIVLGLVVACYVLGLVQPITGAEAQEPLSNLSGSWKLTSVEVDGDARPIEEDVRWTINDDKVLYGGEPLATITRYPSSTPKGIDLVLAEPKTLYEGIYVLEQGELRICLNTRTVGTKERPADFSTLGKSNLRILTFQRLGTGDGPPESQKGFIGMALAVENEAVVIGMVLEKSPAEKAGLQAGDVLLMIGDDRVRDLQTTIDSVRQRTPGSNVAVLVRRDGKEKEIQVKVAAFPFSLLGLLG